MAFSRSVFVLLVLNVVYTYAAVPVFMWGDVNGRSLKSDPLRTVSEETFTKMFESEMQKYTFIAVFVDESLSVEDFSLKNDDGKTVFPYLLSELGNGLYLPSVEQPLLSVEATVMSGGNFIKVTDKGLSAEIEKQDEGLLFISLEDARDGESRADLLQRHNDLMEDMYTKLQAKYDKVLAIYTARQPSWIIPSHSIVRRQVSQEQVSDDYILDGLRLFVNKTWLTVNGELTNVTGFLEGSTTFDEEAGTMSTIMQFENAKLTLNFANKFGYWSFNTVGVTVNNVTDELRGISEVHALMGFAYRCAQNVTFSSNYTSQLILTFRDLKVQPFFKNGTYDFGDSFNCVGFFSVPIWSGLFVVFILLSITFYGIMMMMDIRTMDRFDDPKGKTITINAGE